LALVKDRGARVVEAGLLGISKDLFAALVHALLRHWEAGVWTMDRQRLGVFVLPFL